MKIAIVGSRYWPAYQLVRDFVRGLPHGTTVVTGGDWGVDTVAEDTARACGFEVIVHKPNYRKHGRRAQLERNALIVRDADELQAFWDGASTGTLHVVKLARFHGLEVRVTTLAQRER